MEVAGIKWTDSGMAPTAGRSWVELFRSGKSGRVVEARDHVLLGRERNDIGRPHDQGYPIRGIVKADRLFLQNFEPTRWPAGNPETGYLDVDGGPTKTFILAAHRKNPADPFWALCFGLRPADELYDLKKDPDCVHNLASDPGTASQMAALRDQLYAELQQQEDPRMAGKGAQFDEYPHANKAHLGFYERYMAGEKLNTGWVTPSDYEPKPATQKK
jgi:N-sulfoglucosamine sulfohydrolase